MGGAELAAIPGVNVVKDIVSQRPVSVKAPQ